MATLGGGDLSARPPEGYTEGLDGLSSHTFLDDPPITDVYRALHLYDAS